MRTITFILFFFFTAQISIAQWANQSSGSSASLNSVHFINATQGWIAGDNGTILRTTDAGKTWAAQNSGTSRQLNKIFMVNANVGYAVGKNGTIVKYNGSTWNALTSGTTLELFGVHFINENVGWVSGDWGRIMNTTDGGATWNTQVNNSNFSNAFKGLYMLSQNDGWAVGTTGRVLRYNGTTWSNVSTPAGSVNLHSVSFSSSTNGFMTGSDSRIFHFNGTSWSEHNSGINSNHHIYGIVAVSNNEAYAATTPGIGGQGMVLRYNGNVWSKDYEYTGSGTELFYGVHSKDGRAWAVGAGGIIKQKGGTSTGIASHDVNPFLVIPNPFKGEFTIASEILEASIFTLTDLSGKIVIQKQPEVNVKETSIDASSLPAGIYIAKISTAGSIRMIKVVKTQ
jgi:photosystem II stability/assembly factor-like uncharacterized protein